MEYKGQSLQDEFVLKILNHKKNGYFLEIGSNHPIEINNSYILEKEYEWKGIMIEYDKRFENLYKVHRPNSIHVINDATKVDYKLLLENFPKNIDYLQIDLEVDNRSTLDTLELLDRTVLDDYTFSVVTFEHDIYRGDYFNTRNVSREIFSKHGYILLFPDVKNSGNPYEDWYVHSSCNINIKTENSMEYKDVINYIKNNLYDTNFAQR